jgi:hypothetical protein
VSKHLVLAIELPSFYTADLDLAELRQFAGPDQSDSEILHGCIGEPGVVRLITEISGEKDSEVIEALGRVRTVSLEEPTPGVTPDGLAEQACKLHPDQDEVIELAVRRLSREDVPPDEIIELLEGEIADVRRRQAREATRA